MINKYKRRRFQKTKNLLTGETEADPEMIKVNVSGAAGPWASVWALHSPAASPQGPPWTLPLSKAAVEAGSGCLTGRGALSLEAGWESGPTLSTGRLRARAWQPAAMQQVLRCFPTAPGEKVLSLFPSSDKETWPKCHIQDAVGPEQESCVAGGWGGVAGL